MKITLEVPESFNAMSVAIVYDAYYGATGCKMYTQIISREDATAGKVIDVPSKEG